MNNQELEQKIQKIIAQENYFDIIESAKQFESEYRTSDFYKHTKIALKDLLMPAYKFYNCRWDSIKNRLQKVIDGLSIDKFYDLTEQLSDTFTKENQEIAKQYEQLQDFKDIIKSDKKEA